MTSDNEKLPFTERMRKGIISLLFIILGFYLCYILFGKIFELLYNPVMFIEENLGISFWLSALIIVCGFFLTAYIIGATSPADLIGWRPKGGKKKEFFTIRLIAVEKLCLGKEFACLLEGYVTSSFQQNNETLFNASILSGGWTVVSGLKEESFLRTNKSFAQIMVFYLTGGRIYTPDKIDPEEFAQKLEMKN